MPLRLIVGPANSGKAGAVLGAVRAAIDRDPLLVVPTLPDVDHYRRELAAAGVVFGGHVVRFGWLIEEIARRAGYGEPTVTSLQRDRLIRAAIARCELRELAASARSGGFAAAAGDLIAELQRELVEPARFRAALEAWAPDPRARRYADEVASIYEAFRSGLERIGRVDADLFAWRALDALRNDARRWGETPVAFYGFDDLTGVQLDAVETLARVAGAEVTVALAYEAGRNAFAGRARTFEELRPLAGDIEARPARADHYADRSRAALHHLERRLFEDDPGDEPPAAAGIRILEAGGERAEVELIAAEVLALLRTGVPAERIAVVFRSPRRTAALIRAVFAAYGIPHSLDWRVPLAHTALGRGLLAALRCSLAMAGSDGVAADARELLAYLRTPGRLDLPALADSVEAELRRAGTDDLEAALLAWERRSGWRPGELDRLRDALAAGDLPRLLGELGDLAGMLLSRPRRRQAAVLAGEEVSDARVCTAVLRALRELGDLAAADASAAPAAAELPELLGELEVALGDRAPWTGVHVLGALDVRARRYRALFLCGLGETEFPGPGAPEPFLSDAVRREVNAAGGLRLAMREDPLDAERYLFYACASRAEELLVLSWRSSDEEGNPASPSPFLEDVCELYPGDLLGAPARRRSLADVTWAPEEAPTPAELARSLAARGRRRPPPPISPLRSRAVLDELAVEPVSASGLESYARCPVRWFVERRLNPRRLSPDAVELVRGGILHGALEGTLRRLRDETGTARVTPASLERAKRLADEELRRERAERPGRETAADRAEGVRLERGLHRFLEHEAGAEGWEPQHLELRFGPDTDLGALRLSGGAEVRGMIDRIEVEDGDAIVRDYKSSKGFPVAGWERDGIVQVGLYMLAARRLLGLRPVAGVYQPLRRDLRARGLVLAENGGCALAEGRFVDKDLRDPAEFERCLEDVERRADDMVARMRAGELEARPRTCGYRGNCAYPGICRVEEGR